MVEMKKVRIISLILSVAVVLFAGCGKKKNVKLILNDPDSAISFEPGQSEKIDRVISNWTNENGTIVILFGYGFEDDDFYEHSLKRVEDAYGLAENGGLITPVHFNKDLNSHIANFYNYIKDLNIRGIILFGAPENTAREIAKVQKSFDEKTPFNVFSFFPQDDVLAQEGTCNIIVENKRDETQLEEMTQVMDEGSVDLMIRAVRYIAAVPGPLPVNAELVKHAMKLLGMTKISKYIDSETSLHSDNHFLIDVKK